LKSMPEMTNSRLLAKGNRLSAFPIADEEFDAIVKAGSRKAKAKAKAQRLRMRVSPSLTGRM
ncbi:MAG: EVE domain-containing protein, partial [Actinomycetota bacterium]|nr:EVE domain-containing protein [Actinomycetota bacterium]